MDDAPTVREQIAEAIYDVIGQPMYDWDNGIMPGGQPEELSQKAADAVLAVLGGIDPSADPELLAAHLRADRAEIARLRTQLDHAEGIRSDDD